MAGNATPHNAAKPKRRHSWAKRLPIPDAQPMGRTGGRDDRKRWHILEHTKPVCGRIEAGDIVWHAPFAAVKDKRICDHCHGRFSWRPVTQDFEYVDLGYETPCKVWRRGLMSEGYGSRGNPYERKNKLTHREAYEQAHGDIPAGYVVHHLCGQKTCLEPTHLEAVSRAEHIAIHRRTFDYSAAAGMYRSGLRGAAIAAELGIRRHTVQRALDRMRKRGEL